MVNTRYPQGTRWRAERVRTTYAVTLVTRHDNNDLNYAKLGVDLVDRDLACIGNRHALVRITIKKRGQDAQTVSVMPTEQ